MFIVLNQHDRIRHNLLADPEKSGILQQRKISSRSNFDEFPRQKSMTEKFIFEPDLMFAFHGMQLIFKMEQTE
jgi:hypothetical protein